MNSFKQWVKEQCERDPEFAKEYAAAKKRSRDATRVEYSDGCVKFIYEGEHVGGWGILDCPEHS